MDDGVRKARISAFFCRKMQPPRMVSNCTFCRNISVVSQMLEVITSWDGIVEE